jgi:hypothetical protein
MGDMESEDLRFWGGWKGFYVFVLIYGALQILLLYLLSRAFNLN